MLNLLIDQVAEILQEAYGSSAACAVAFRVSQPEEKIIRTTLEKLVETVRSENITHQALIIVGKVLEVGTENLTVKSRLYDKDFSHGYRK